MRSIARFWQLIFLAIAALALCAQTGAQHSPAARAKPLPPMFTQALPALDGHHLLVDFLELNYAPGQSTPPHTHSCPIIAHIAEGAMRVQIQGQPAHIYKAGDTFYEAPHGIHLIAQNVSQKNPAKVLIFVVCDHPGPIALPVNTGSH
ncbi:MAG TPA: cupin domain-containing protein [Candidatus Acidoferrales bacterium]|nr:cupin domain-containing protein [Candidatus Acidoferrales bacterium]